MQLNELKAVLKKTDEVAVYPEHVEVDNLPWPLGSRKVRHQNRNYCPSGMVKARVLKTGWPWIEKRPVAVCGDQDFEIQRKNGILIELVPSECAQYFRVSDNRIKRKKIDGGSIQLKHSELITRNGKKYIQLVTSLKCIVAPWGEYALLQAQREKESYEVQEKLDRLLDAQAAIMGITRDELDKRNRYGTNHYLGTEMVQNYALGRNGSYKRDKNGNRIKEKEFGRIEITVDQAEKIYAMLTQAQIEKLKDIND